MKQRILCFHSWARAIKKSFVCSVWYPPWKKFVHFPTSLLKWTTNQTYYLIPIPVLLQEECQLLVWSRCTKQENLLVNSISVIRYAVIKGIVLWKEASARKSWSSHTNVCCREKWYLWCTYFSTTQKTMQHYICIWLHTYLQKSLHINIQKTCSQCARLFKASKSRWVKNTINPKKCRTTSFD